MLHTLSHILSCIYGAAVEHRNKAYDIGKKKNVRIPAFVISVGNLSMGGTGKTPFVQMLGRMLAEKGLATAIVSRGYGRTSKGEVIASNGLQILASVAEVGDEVFMNAEILLNAGLSVPFVVNADKAAAARTAVERFGAQIVIVDDGFQHRRLDRDCDIVLIDRQTIENPRLLPAGRLREPLESLRRANIIVCMNGVCIEEVPETVLLPDTLVVAAQTTAASIYAVSGEYGGETTIGALSGIAKPERFYTMLKNNGLTVRETFTFADHYRYKQRDIKHILQASQYQGLRCIVTTEKDAVKLRKFHALFAQAAVTLAVLPVRIAITHGNEELKHYLLSRCQGHP